MKLLLLTVALGLVYADNISELSGQWRTQYIASTNTAMTDEGGPLRAYVRSFNCDSGCKTVTISFYVKTPECQLMSVEGTLTTDKIYTTDYSGQNYFQFLHISENLVVMYIKNVNGESVTEITEAFGKQPLTSEQLDTFYSLTNQMGVPTQTARYIPPQDTCPQ